MGSNWVTDKLVDFKLNSILKGIVVSLLSSLSSLIYTFSSNIFGGIWTIMTTIIFGASIGYIIDKINNY